MNGSIPWIEIAKLSIGVKEIPGKDNNPVIQKWLTTLKAWWKDDATPWCGTFVAHCIEAAGLPVAKNWFRAKAWLEYGLPLQAPIYGCIVVFEREGGGHVGFVVGRCENGNLMVLGGNQGDEVNVRAFARARVAGYRWPPNTTVPLFKELPLLAASAPLSTNEA